jgi:hypothetical protein
MTFILNDMLFTHAAVHNASSVLHKRFAWFFSGRVVHSFFHRAAHCLLLCVKNDLSGLHKCKLGRGQYIEWNTSIIVEKSVNQGHTRHVFFRSRRNIAGLRVPRFFFTFDATHFHSFAANIFAFPLGKVVQKASAGLARTSICHHMEYFLWHHRKALAGSLSHAVSLPVQFQQPPWKLNAGAALPSRHAAATIDRAPLAVVERL